MIGNSDGGNGGTSNILNKTDHYFNIKSPRCLDHTAAVFVSQVFPRFGSSVNLFLTCL